MTTSPSTPRRDLAERIMEIVWRRPADSLAERTRRRVAFHLIPFLFFLYILAYLDRVNVSVAQLKMELPSVDGGMGFTKEIIGFGAGLFFLGYWLLEIPSTISVERWGARWVFVRILVLWGICAALVGSIGTSFCHQLFVWLPHIAEHSAFTDSIDGALQVVVGWAVHWYDPNAGAIQWASGAAQFFNSLPDNPTHQFYFFRFMLGFFEGGFFPSVIVYLSLWFRAQDRAKAIAGFMAAIPLSSLLGMPISGLLLDVHWFGIQGWRWVFILEGIAPVLAGFATLFFLPDRPSKAAWLSNEERDWLLAELDLEHRVKKMRARGAWKHHIGIVLLLTVVYFCQNVTSYGLSMFMPAIIRSQSGVSDRVASLLAALPFLMGLIAMLINGWHSDRRHERIWHVAVPTCMLGLSILVAAALDHWSPWPVVVMILLVGTFMYAHLPAFWPLPNMFLGATAAASAIGFINMIGNLGGFFGPKMVGKAVEGQSSFAPALFKLAPFSIVAAAIILAVGYFRKRHPIESAKAEAERDTGVLKTAAASRPK